MNYHATTTIVALASVASILWLIRKDHLHPRNAIWWICVCASIGLLGVFPQISDWMAHLLGVNYPPTLILVLAIVVLLIKLLRQDIARTKEHQTTLILSQRISILEKRFEDIFKDHKKP